MNKKQQIFYLVVLIIIASNSFYQFKLFMDYESIMKFVYYFFILFAIVLAYVFSSNKQNRIKCLIDRSQPWVLMILLFVVILISVFNAFIYKNQPLTIGLMTSLQPLSAYFLFFAVIGLGLSVNQFEKLLIFFGVTYVIILLIGYLTIPNPLFGLYGIDEDRGGVIRFRLPGYFWTVALFFYSIQRFKENSKIKFLALIIICFFASVLTFARQYLFFTLFLGSFFYLSGISLKKKLTFILLGLIFLIFVIPNTQIYKNFTSLTQEQFQKNKYEEEDLRVKDYRVFLFDYPRSGMQYLFGCGQGSYGNSSYGEELEKMVKFDHLIQADTGWAGFVFFYGYIGALLLLIIILKSLFLKCPKRYTYLKYIILYMSLCAILGGTILYYYECLIIFLSIYILYRVSSTKTISALLNFLICNFLLYSTRRNKLKTKSNIEENF